MTAIRSKFTVYLSLVIGSLVLLGACQSEPEAQGLTATTFVPTTFVATPTTVIEMEATQPVETEAVVDQCMGCHTDKQMLIDTANPEEEVISENEGAG